MGSVLMAISDDCCRPRKILSNSRSSSVKSPFILPADETEVNDSPDRGVADVMVADRPDPFV